MKEVGGAPRVAVLEDSAQFLSNLGARRDQMKAGRFSLAISAILALVVCTAFPASAKGRTAFVVTGGGLKHPVSFTSDDLAVGGEWTRSESHVPTLSGPRFQVTVLDPESNNQVTAKWVYVPQASGAIPISPTTFSGHPLRALDGGPYRWIAFSPAFNEAFRRAISSPPFHFDSLAVPLALVLLLAGAALGVRSARQKARRFGLASA